MADETGTTQAQANTGTDTGQQSAQAQAQPTQEMKFTQADLERILAERLAREKSKYADYDTLKAKAEELESANKSEIEKALERAAKAEAKQKEVEAQAHAREQIATAKSIAAELGFEPKKLDKVIRMVDLTAEMDADAIRKSLEALASEMPELLGKKQPPAGAAANPQRADSAPAETRDAKLQRIRGGGSQFQDWLSGATVVIPHD